MKSDDISSQLIASESSDKEEIFEYGMKKHKETAVIIRQNCTAQDNILKVEVFVCLFVCLFVSYITVYNRL